jgi:hypothetical protein
LGHRKAGFRLEPTVELITPEICIGGRYLDADISNSLEVVFFVRLHFDQQQQILENHHHHLLLLEWPCPLDLGPPPVLLLLLSLLPPKHQRISIKEGKLAKEKRILKTINI